MDKFLNLVKNPIVTSVLGATTATVAMAYKSSFHSDANVLKIQKLNDQMYNVDSKLKTLCEKVDSKLNTLCEKVDSKLNTLCEKVDNKLNTLNDRNTLLFQEAAFDRKQEQKRNDEQFEKQQHRINELFEKAEEQRSEMLKLLKSL
jgi:Skp family chaperone for outer membrane proteins